jgi:hypothetical protein
MLEEDEDGDDDKTNLDKQTKGWDKVVMAMEDSDNDDDIDKD